MFRLFRQRSSLIFLHETLDYFLWVLLILFAPPGPPPPLFWFSFFDGEHAPPVPDVRTKHARGGVLPAELPVPTSGKTQQTGGGIQVRHVTSRHVTLTFVSCLLPHLTLRERKYNVFLETQMMFPDNTLSPENPPAGTTRSSC